VLTQEPPGGLPLLVEGAVALGLGLFIGLEREHRHVDRPDEGPVILGVRSFALLALAGWLAGVLEPRWGWLPPVLLGLMGLLVVAQYVRESAGGARLGLTTEMAALLTMVYGLLVRHDVQLAVALSLVTTLVLISKPWARGVVPRLLRTELVAALPFLVVAAVVLASLTDVDAIALASSRGVEGGTLPADTARLAILVAAASNTLVKGGYAWLSRGRPSGAPSGSACWLRWPRRRWRCWRPDARAPRGRHGPALARE
jgi:hypothetical protein